jgi:hypothetical protein
MARIRSIKPSYAQSLDIAQLSIPTRLHFILLWTYADDAGRGIDDPRLIKAALWPLDEDVTFATIDAMQTELESADRIIRYTNSGRAYFQIVGFQDHQKPNRPAPSRIPPHTHSDTKHTENRDSLSTHGGLTADSVSPAPPGPVETVETVDDHHKTPGQTHSLRTHCTLTEDSLSTHGGLTPVVVGESRVEESSFAVSKPTDTNTGAAPSLAAGKPTRDRTTTRLANTPEPDPAKLLQRCVDISLGDDGSHLIAQRKTHPMAWLSVRHDARTAEWAEPLAALIAEHGTLCPGRALELLPPLAHPIPRRTPAATTPAPSPLDEPARAQAAIRERHMADLAAAKTEPPAPPETRRAATAAARQALHGKASA